ncbi:Ger(x)C family germination protein [Paenibacillus taihuensis]|uniref:Ger(X)C family germination protein n=1 Tax=Paenibacillus taihuensis TaxID=1156355 RepID=A0A3D9S1G7_9BACL|nr:Ger(x)C family spore germination protein [Paenibacillus taihuensis]REE82705.1 Ger(x)C family germination protein [Paenibacillus taihuensis]
MKYNRILLLTVMLLSLAGLTGGCGFKDIDKRFFVVAIGIDPPAEGAKGYKVTLRLAVPSPKVEPGAAKSRVETIQATTIAEGVRLLKSHVDKELDFGHCKLLLFGEELVKKDFRAPMQWFARRRDIQSVAYVAIGKPDANSILNVEPSSERLPGNAIFLTFGHGGTESSYTLYTYLFDLLRRAGERGLDPILPIMRVENNGYVVTRLGLLDKSKLVTVLNPQETEMFNQIRYEFKKSTVAASFGGQNMVMSVDGISSKTKIVRTNEGYVLRLRLKIKGIFEEAPIGVYDQDWKKLEQTFNAQVEQEAERLLKKVQQAGVDPFGFGLKFRATHAGSEKTWKAWESIYPRLKFDVKANVIIEGSGIIR